MQQSEFTLETKDRLTLRAKSWHPDVPPKAGILLIHGIGEHIGRYQHVAEFFTQAGYLFTGFDLRGHGKSEGSRGHAPSFDSFLDDIHLGIEKIRGQFPQLPIFLYGHSLGANLVLCYSISRNSNPVGTIATSPALGVKVPIPPMKMFVGKIMYKLYPTFQLKNGLNPEHLSRDANVGKAYQGDPLVHSITTARLGLDLLNSGQFILNNARNIQYPLLLMQGTSDLLVNPELTRTFAEKTSPDLVTYKEWVNHYHELHNEPDKVEVLQTMLTWMESLLS